MEIVSLVLAALDLANKLIERGRQTGELTPDQDAALQMLAKSIFAKFAEAPPPPPGA